MAIQIIDGFQVNTASPIDNRIVASGSTARNAIPYKYEGLRVFDTSDSIPYVWLNGAWVSENASGIVASGTTTNYIPVLNGTNLVGNSVIYQSGSNIGVNTISPSATFSVNGSLSANTLSGDGSGAGSNGVTVNASNITTGSLSLSRLTNGSNGFILVGAAGGPTYSNPTQITVGTASNANNVVVSSNTANATNYIAFFPSTGNNGARIHTGGLSYNPSTKLLNTNGGDVYLSSSSSSNGYVVMGTRNYNVGGLGNSSFNTLIASVNVSSLSAITVEVTFTGNIKQYSGFTIVGSQYRSTKYIAGYTTNASGVITQSGSTNTILNVSSAGSGSVTLSAGTIDISTSGVIKFYQGYTSASTSEINITVDYKITIN